MAQAQKCKFSKEIVVVLGAGASAEAKFPTGKQLRDRLVITLNDETRPVFKKLVEIGIGVREIQAFHKTLRDSRRPTLDEFIARKRDYDVVARTAIAACLSELEDPNVLARAEWYGALAAQLQHAIETGSDFPYTFVTFNYDRSLEHCLFEALRDGLPEGTTNPARDIGDLGILHVYGQLGYLPWQTTGTSRDYSKEVTIKDIEIAREGILLINDQRAVAQKNLKAIQGVVAKAKKVFFLGFGFDNLNLERLGLPLAHKNCEFAGTCFGMSPPNNHPAFANCSGCTFSSETVNDFVRKLFA